MRYEFHPEAFGEYSEAGCHYARQQPGLDLRFIVRVEKAVELILEAPYGGVRSMRMFVDASFECFLTASFTLSSQNLCLSSPLPIAVANPATGSTESTNCCWTSKIDGSQSPQSLFQKSFQSPFIPKNHFFPSVTIDIAPPSMGLKKFASLLRDRELPTMGYVEEDKFRLDLRTTSPEQDEAVIENLREG